MKIAILHEMLVKLGGAEKVVKKFLDMYPNADLFTLIYDEKKVASIFPKNYAKSKHIQTPPLTQNIYELTKKQRLCLPFMARAVESLDFRAYDVVLVSSSGFAHGLLTSPETKTIIYYHSPARYLWDWTHEYRKSISMDGGIKGYLFTKLLSKIRRWDFIAGQRGSIALANSKNVATRIQKYYRKSAQVVYPPIETQRFQRTLQESTGILEKHGLKSKKYAIIVGALTEFKKVDVAIKNFPDSGDIELAIVGEGDQKKHLQELAQKNTHIHFTGAVFGDELVELMQHALCLIFPGEEDFGIVPLEANGAGIPVFALRAGGLKETIIEGVSGEFFDDPLGGDFQMKFQNFLKKISQGMYQKEEIKKQAEKYSEELFEEKIREIIEEK